MHKGRIYCLHELDMSNMDIIELDMKYPARIVSIRGFCKHWQGLCSSQTKEDLE